VWETLFSSYSRPPPPFLGFGDRWNRLGYSVATNQTREGTAKSSQCPRKPFSRTGHSCRCSEGTWRMHPRGDLRDQRSQWRFIGGTRILKKSQGATLPLLPTFMDDISPPSSTTDTVAGNTHTFKNSYFKSSHFISFLIFRGAFLLLNTFFPICILIFFFVLPPLPPEKFSSFRSLGRTGPATSLSSPSLSPNSLDSPLFLFYSP